MHTWRWPKVPVLWTVYQPPYDRAGHRLVIVRTAKSLSYISVNDQGEFGSFARYRRPLAYDWTFDQWQSDEDFRAAMRKPYQEKPRWQQLPLALGWPPEPPNVIQLQFRFPDEIRFRMAA